MNILELDSYDLADAVKFHNRLNPRLWGQDEHLQPKVQSRLQEIAEYFQEFLGVPDLDVKDITISGSNAAYSYTPHSDIDLHLVVAMPPDPVYQELFAAKKYEFNDTHNIQIGGADVELYVQPADQVHHSQGIYSIKNQTWVQVPQRKRAKIDDACVRDKVSDLDARIHKAIQSHNVNTINSLWQKIRSMRQSGLEQHGEFGCENITFKLLRNKGCIKALKTAMDQARDRELSLAELARPQQRVRYGFRNVDDEQVEEASLADMRDAFQTELRPGVDLSKQKVYRSRDEYQKAKDQQARQQEIAKELVRTKPRPWPAGVSESPDGVNPTTAMFLTEADPESIVDEFIQHTAERLGIKRMPEIFIHHDEDWSKENHSFGMYVPERHELHVSLGNRHLLDILRTTAHELCHCAQHEQKSLPDNAGVTGSAWENEAHAVAGIVMRDFADAHPDYFKMAPVQESASGYIPKNKKEARDPRYSMAVTVDVGPGQVGKEANKLALHTGRNGEPALLMKSANLQESLAAEFAVFESQDLFEINMGSKNLRREAAKTGAIAGMEFEMIVPNVEGGSGDADQEPDYDQDQRCRSIQDAFDFFYDGDWNSRRSCDEMRDKMRDDYTEWLDEKIATDWERGGDEYIAEWVKNNVDESEWNPDDLAGDARNEALEEYAANVHADPVSDQYQSAYEEFREENQESYDESDWLDDADLDHMTNIENAYSMSWPHWSDPQSGGEASIEDIAQEFENAIGRDVRASGNYHSGSVIRPSPTQIRYVVEPDGSLEPDDPNDQGLEFVSPPLPIDEILSDLNKVKKWAKEYGCYTNDSTGLHINISVPDYSREKLDFVKLALLMGDKYVLDAFGRSGNTYAKSALDIVKRAVRDNPDNAAQLLNKMKGNMDQLASKAIHSGITSKYTSINTKDGHIEFRSPGGDWLDQNFDQIENTLLRFTVAMSAAMNPAAYREEYLTKLYKLLTENNRGDDTIRYFADYVAGKIPKAALRSFVKQAQLQRNIQRGKTDGKKMWWKVYKDGKNAGRYSYTVEVVATSEKEAIEKAAKEWGEPLLVNTLARMDAEPLRPYVEQPGGGTYELYNRLTGETIPDTEFSARNQSDVETRVDDYVNHGQHGQNSVDARLMFGARYAADSGSAGQDASSNPLRPTGPGPWEVYNRTTNNSTVNLVQGGQPITNRGEAQRLAMNLISAGRHDLYGVRTIGTSGTPNIGTQTDMENRLGLPSQSADANYAVVDRRTLDPVFRFQAGNRRDANGIYGEWLAAAGLPTTTEDYGFQEIRPESVAQRPSEIPRDWRIVDRATDETLNTVRGASQDQALAVRDDTARRHGVDASQLSLQVVFNPDAAQGGIVDIAPDVAQNFPPDRTDGRDTNYSFRDLFGRTDQASSAPAGNSFSGQWRILDGDTGTELFRFRSADPSQAEANRIAYVWLQQNAPDSDFREIEVVPVMTESVQQHGKPAVAEGESNDTAISLSKLGKFHPGADTLAQFVPERATAQYALHPDKWESTFYSLTNKDSDKLKYYGPKKISIPPGTLVGDMAIANKFYRAKTTEEKQQYAEAYKASLQPYPVDVGEYRMPELLMPKPGVTEGNDLTEIAAMPAHQFAGGKDMLGMFQTPTKKHLKPLPGGTDLQYAIETNRYGSIVQIVDPGMPGITRPEVVAVLNLDSSNLPNTVQVGSITVDEDYRGRGLAKSLYGIVLTIMRKNLVSGSSQTPGGRRNWMSLASIPGVEVQGLVRIPNQIFDMARTATVSPQWRKYAERTVDQIMELGGQFHSKDNNSTYWLFDVVPGKGSLQPAVRNALSRLYGYDSDNLLLATWTGA